MALSTVMIGTLGVSYKFVLEDFDPLFAMGLRTLIASGAVAAITWKFAHKSFRKSTVKHLMISAFLHATASILFILGLKETFALNSAILALLSPVLIYIGSIVFLRESYDTRSLIGAGISLMGGVLLVGAPLMQGESLSANKGDILIFLSIIVLTVMFLHTKRLYEDITAHQILSYRMLMSGAVIIGVSAVSGESFDVSAVSWQAWAGLAYAAIIIGALALLLLYSALNYMKAEDTASLFYLNPLAGVLASALVLGERLEDSALIAGSIIVVGVLLAHPAHMNRMHMYEAIQQEEHILKKWLNHGLALAHIKRS